MVPAGPRSSADEAAQQRRLLSALQHRLPDRRLLARFVVTIATVAVATAMSLVALELYGRHQRWEFAETRAVVAVDPPGAHLYETDSTLGYRLVPNQRLTIRLAQATFTETTTQQGHRATSSDTSVPARPEIWVFGCSYTFGWGIDDGQTYPWLLQRAFPDYAVVNFGVGGYGTYQSLLEYERALRAGGRPAVTVLAHADFHNARNVMSPMRKRQIALAWRNWGEVNQPYVILSPSGELLRRTDQGGYLNLPLLTSSVVANQVDLAIARIRERRALRQDHREEITRRLVAEFAQLSKSHHVPFVLAAIEGGADLIDHCHRNGILAGDVSARLDEPGMQVPGDGHPSAKAQAVFAARLATLLAPVLTSDRATMIDH